MMLYNCLAGENCEIFVMIHQTCRIGVSSVEDPRDSIGIWEPMIVGQRDSTSGNQMIVGQRVSELTPTQESKVCDMA